MKKIEFPTKEQWELHKKIKRLGATLDTYRQEGNLLVFYDYELFKFLVYYFLDGSYRVFIDLTEGLDDQVSGWINTLTKEIGDEAAKVN